MFRSLAAEATSMIAVGSTAPPLTDGSSDALKYTYQNKGRSAQSGGKKNVLANNKDLLPEQQSCPLFLMYYISLFKQPFERVAFLRAVYLRLSSAQSGATRETHIPFSGYKDSD